MIKVCRIHLPTIEILRQMKRKSIGRINCFITNAFEKDLRKKIAFDIIHYFEVQCITCDSGILNRNEVIIFCNVLQSVLNFGFD